MLGTDVREAAVMGELVRIAENRRCSRREKGDEADRETLRLPVLETDLSEPFLFKTDVLE